MSDGLKIYGISIRTARLRGLTDRLSPLEFTIVDGVNGERLMPRALEEDRIYKPLPYMRLSRGTLGCYLSHRSVWEKIAEGEDEYALVLEDDANFTARDVKHVKKLVEEVHEFDHHWNVIIIGQVTKRGVRDRKAPKGMFVPAPSFGLHAYIVSKRGAAHLLADALPIKDPVDIYVTSVPMKGRYATFKNVCEALNFGSDVNSIG
jgi:glycosyl transferase family 25